MKNPFQRKIGLVLSGALALGLAGTCTAMAQTGPDRVTEQYKAWTVTCATQAAATEGAAPTRACAMEQAAKDQQSGSAVLRFIVASGQAGADPVATIIGPFGVDLAQGLGIVVDGTPVETVPFKTCLQVGCIGYLTLDEQHLDILRGGASLTVVIKPSDNPEKEMALPISLAGFADAFARTTAAQ